MKPGQKSQIEFFKRIIKSVKPHLNPATEIARVLDIDISAVYKRINGEILIKFDAIEILEETFLSVAQNQPRSRLTPKYPFEYAKVSYKAYTTTAQKKDILRELQHADNDHSSHMYFSAKDLSLFRLYAFEKLTAFQNYWLQKMVLVNRDYANKNFNLEEELKSEDIAISKEIAKCYNKIPSTEIWGLDTFDSTLYLITDCHRRNLIATPDFKALMDELRELASQLERDAENGYKGDNKSAKLTLAQHNMHRFNDHSMLEMHDTKVTYIQQNCKDILMLNHLEFGNDVAHTIKAALSIGTHLSNQNATARRHYFKEIQSRINVAANFDPKNSSAIIIAGIIEN